MKTDVVIIGAGAVGCAIARELSRYQLDVTVVEKNEDVGGDASKSNSAIIHTGYDASPGTLESQLVVAANPMYDQLTRDLDIPFKSDPSGDHGRTVRKTPGDQAQSIYEPCLRCSV